MLGTAPRTQHKLLTVACSVLLAGVLAVHALPLSLELEPPAAEPVPFKVVVNPGVRADAL